MNPNYNATITLYNCLRAKDNPGKKDVWKIYLPLKMKDYYIMITEETSGR